MKNLILKFALLLFAGTICSFQASTPTLQDIFQAALNIEILEEHFTKNNNGELLPLTLVSNDYIAKDMALNFAGKKVLIQSSIDKISTKKESVLELTEIKMKGKKAQLSFKYGEKTIKVRLKKKGSDWISKTVSLKWKNGFETQIVEQF